jgi:hypothetical protein
VVTSDDVELYAGAAYMLEYERNRSGASGFRSADPWAHRLSSYLAFAIRLDDGLRLTSTTYVQPRIGRSFG